MSDMSTLKAGDLVLYRYMGGRFQKATVEKVTPTGRIKVCGQMFNAMGYQMGGSTWHKSYIDPFDQKILDDQAKTERVNLMRRELADANWRGMDDLLVAKIHAMLPAPPEPK